MPLLKTNGYAIVIRVRMKIEKTDSQIITF